MARTDNLKNYLTDVADAIREKTNTTDKIKASEFDDKIKEISGDSEQWEWASNNVINFSSANPTFFKGMTYLKVVPNYFNEECAKITNWSNAFNGCSNLVDIDIDTSAGTNFTNMFYNCTKFQKIDSIDTSEGTIFSGTFYGCGIVDGSALSKDMDFSKATTLFECFLGNKSMVTSPKIITQATNMRGIFYNCTNLETVLEIDTSNATNIQHLFGLCSKLKTVDLLDTSKAQNMYGVFQDCSSIESVPTLDLTSATSISYLFKGCSKLKKVELVNVPDRKFDSGTVCVFNNCTSLEKIERTANPLCRGDCNNFASGCTSLIEFDQDTSKVTSFYHMFDGDTSLETIKTIDGTVSQGFADTFKNCSALKNIEITPNTIKLNISFVNSPLLTDVSIQNIIDGLATVTTQRILTLHADVKAKLTDEQNNTITSKNWKVA